VAAGRVTATRDRLLLSFAGVSLGPAGAEAIARRAAGVTLYRHLNVESPGQVRVLTDALQAAAARLGLPPLLIAADHETGQLHAMGDGPTPFAGAMALGAVGDVVLAERVAFAIGTELRAMGVNLVYAPDADLATNPRNLAVGIRSFGEDPAAAGRLVAASVRGLQGAGVAATIKHFPGHGAPSGDSHHGLPVIERSADELREREIVPFVAGIDAGSRVAMAGHLAIPALTGRRDLAATLAPEVLRTLLRGDLGFGGVTVSDALDMGAVTGGNGTGVDVATALDAGTDLLLCGPDPAAQARVEAGLGAAAVAGRLDRREAEGAVARVGDLRTWLAGFEQPPIDVVGSSEHQSLADELARRSITRIRDRDGQLPLRPRDGDRILVVEPRPRDLTPADTTSWLPVGGLASALRERWPATAGIVVGAPISESERAAIAARAGDADLVVLGTVDALGEPSQAVLARALVARGARVVAVALRAPWDADAYPEVGTVVATYGIQPPTLRALAAALAGEAPINGRLPVLPATD
jgi:beta-N-acetylhexosaminidase